ncbi:MAG: HAD family phosphatase [Pseudomonadota bacterium]
MKETPSEINLREKPCSVEVAFFDFGGVLAEEGYREGLLSIARLHGLDPLQFLKTAVELTFKEGFVTGRIDEKTFWKILREETGIHGSDEDLRTVVLSSFELRPWMIEWVKKLKSSFVRTAILSDQTTWLEELNEKYDFFPWFERIFNSYYTGMSKRDASVFDYAVAEMGVKPHYALFVDDNLGNIERARQKGLNAIHYQNREDFEKALLAFCPFLKV